MSLLRFGFAATLALAASSPAFGHSSSRLLKRATVSPDGSCGGTSGYTCQGSNFGNSCGPNNKCGRDFGSSKLSSGCQPAYGFCYPSGSVSPDGSCGGSDMFICIGSNYGDSCGRNNLCGRDAGYSGAGCQPQYGYCQQCTTTVQPSTIVSTSQTTTTLPVTISASTTVTVTSGISLTTTTTTTTSISVSTSYSTIVTTSTPTTVVIPTTTFTTTTTSSGISSTTTTSRPLLMKRDVATVAAGYAVPSLPPLRSGANSPAQSVSSNSSSTTGNALLLRRAIAAPGLSCGTVISAGFTTTTTTTTTTLTSFSTTTTVSSKFTTIPATTSTITSVSTSISVTITIITTTSTFFAQTPTITSVSTSVSIVIVPSATSTIVLTGPPQYTKQYERTDTNNCFYSGSYYKQVGVSADSTNNYQTGVTQCAAACTGAGSSCLSFYFAYSVYSNGGGSFCFLDASPYVAGSVTCNYATNTYYQVDYNKNNT